MNALTFANTQMVLASGSPRRLELMRMMGFDPRVRVSSVDEVPDHGEDGTAYTRRLCREKAEAVRHSLNDDDPHWILAADTVVERDGQILEKPHTTEHAFEMLCELRGCAHTVTTSFCWLHRGGHLSDVGTVTATVFFRDVEDTALRNYIQTGEPMDKAGAYGAQGIGAFLVERIDGSYHTIVGLPVGEVIESLTALGGLTEFPFVEK